MTIKDIIARYNAAMADKEVWNAIYHAVFRMTMPNRDSFYMDQNIPNNWENTRLLTNVGAEAADTFASRFQRIICTDGKNAVILDHPFWVEDSKELREIDSRLEKAVNECIVANLGNYLESAYDLVAGTCVGYRTFNIITKKFSRVPVPIKDVAMSKAFTGETDGYYRKLKLKREEIPSVFPETKGMKIGGQYTTDKNKSEEIELKEATVYNYEDNQWHYYVIYDEQALVDRISPYCDFSSSFWTRRPGTVYGIGVGLKALPELNQLNALRYYGTFGIMFRSAPMWLVNENHMLDYDRLEMRPMELIPVQSTGKDNPTLTPLTLGDDPNVQQWNQAQMEMNIKAVMTSDTIPNQTNKEMTASEIAVRANRLNVTNNIMTAIAQKMLEDDVKWLLRTFKSIEGFYPEGFDVNSYIEGLTVSLASTEVKNTEEIQSIATMIDMFNVASPDGSLTASAINRPKCATKISELLRVPKDIVNPEKTIEENLININKQKIQEETERQRGDMIKEIIINATKNGKLPE